MKSILIKMYMRLKKYKFFRTINKFRRKLKENLWCFFHLGVIYRLKRVSLRDLKLLSYDIPFLITNELHTVNDYYGQAFTLKRYSGIAESYPLKCVVVHGADLVDYITDGDVNSILPNIITMSRDGRRQSFERISNKKRFAIGPYIAYADSFLSDNEIKKEHDRLGKNILFFPVHSHHHVVVDYNIKDICQKLKSLAGNYDSIRVCLYWKDILLGYNKTYEDFGFECVSAGHIYDKYFLRRLRSIIEISDITASNSVGTSLGYSIYLNKPHYLMNQELNYKADDIAKGTIGKQILADKQNEIVFDIFHNFNEVISKDQYDIVDRYFGLSCVKTKEELRAIFEECENNFKGLNIL